jgi:AcrR family transcriptional regulator
MMDRNRSVIWRTRMASNADPIASSIWVRPPKRRSGQPTLTREQIVRATVELLDAEGLDGFSMRRLGAKLDAGATSLYWHVTNKDGLLELAMDAVMGEIEIPDPDEVDWRTALRGYAHGLRSMILRHGWITSLFGVTPNLGPQSMRLSERATEVLVKVGFSGMDVAYAGSALSSHAIGSAVVETAWRRVADRSGRSVVEMMDEVRPYMDQIADEHPTLSQWYRENPITDMGKLYEDSFNFGLERILDGIEQWVEQSRRR